MIEFKVDNDIKQEFLNSKPTSTANSDIYILQIVDAWEVILNKSIYNMTHNELKELIAVKFKNSSRRTVKKNVSVLRGYIDFCVKGRSDLTTDKENKIDFWTVEDINEFVSQDKVKEKYITLDELKRCENILINSQDKLFLRLPYWGIRGRTTKDGTCEEIINLSIDDVDEDTNKVIVRKNNGESREVQVDTNTIELIKEVYNDEYYYENNGEMPDNARNKNPKKRIVNHVGSAVLRIPTKDKYRLFDGAIINARMVRLQKFVGNEGITINNLYFSGMIEMALKMYKEKGVLVKEDYVAICTVYDYGNGKPERYWGNLKEIVEQYI